MNILFVCDTDPEKSSFGNEQRTHYIYEALKTLGDVYAAHISTAPHANVESVPEIVFSRQSGIARVANSIWFRFANRFLPRVMMEWLPFGLKSNIGEVFLGVKFDIVVKRYVYGLGRAHLWNVAPLFVDVDDHLMEVFTTTFLKHKNSASDRIAYWIQQWILHQVERHIEGGWIANPQQANLVKSRRPVAALKNIPMAPEDRYNPSFGHRDLIFTVGLMSYAPNFEGVDDFVRNIWPEAHRRFPDLEYHIVGRGAPDAFAARWQAVPGVKVRGFVEELSELYQRAVATVVPVAKGGGTCIKTLESLAHSRACLSTEFGLRGFSEEDVERANGALQSYGDSNTFCNLLEQLIVDTEYRAACEKNARVGYDSMCSVKVFAKTVTENILSSL